jgi:protein-tyrosine phosphatase
MVDVAMDSEEFIPDFRDRPDLIFDLYLAMIEHGRDRIASAIRALAEPGALPAVFHCAAGKDRTGIVAALVLSLCGVDDETIADDYALSAPNMERMIAWGREHRPEVMDRMIGQPAAIIGAERATMVEMLGWLRTEHGDAERFVRSIGVDDAAIARLRAALVEP